MTAKSPASPRSKALPDAEVQTLAETALLAWESGVEATVLDTLGGEWSMLPERSAISGLWLIRSVGDEPDAVVAKQFVNASDLGKEMIVADLASRVIAVVQPA